MYRTRISRTFAAIAACCAITLAVAGAAFASNGPNYGNFNPLTGKPYSISPQIGLKYTLPQGFKTDAQTTGDSAVPVATSSEPVTRTVRTVVHDHGSQTLPLSLSGAALFIAIAGMGYTLLRVARLRRPARAR